MPSNGQRCLSSLSRRPAPALDSGEIGRHPLRSQAIAGVIRPRLSALARNDPTLLAKNVQHHAKLVPHLPVGKSILLPRGKSTGRQLTCISALDRPVRPRHLVQEAERLTRALGVDDGKITPHAYGVDDNAGP